MNFIIRLLITAAVAYGLTYILTGIHITDFKTAIIFALVLALLNLLLKPILVILTLPITIVTLGLFLLVINTIIIMLCANLIKGFSVAGFWWALAFSVLLSLVSGALNSMFTKSD